MSNPILTATSKAVDDIGYPVSSISIFAPAVTGTAVAAIAWAEWEDDAAEIERLAPPQGVEIMARRRVPDTILPLPSMTDAERWIVDAAWRQGAWDIVRTEIPAGYAGVLPPQTAAIETRDGYVTWTWRPMLAAPEIRLRAAQRNPDVTICPYSSTREGCVSPGRLPPRLSGQPKRHVIRLGRSSRQERDRPRQASRVLPATDPQKMLIAHLLRQRGEDCVLPADLDRRAASAWIDRLKGTVPPEPSRKPRAIHKARMARTVTVNQWRMIEYLQHILGRPSYPLAHWMTLTYDDACAIIEDLQVALKTRSRT